MIINIDHSKIFPRRIRHVKNLLFPTPSSIRELLVKVFVLTLSTSELKVILSWKGLAIINFQLIVTVFLMENEILHDALLYYIARICFKTSYNILDRVPNRVLHDFIHVTCNQSTKKKSRLFGTNSLYAAWRHPIRFFGILISVVQSTYFHALSRNMRWV